MQLNPYLHFNGQCAAALNFYGQALGAKTEFVMTFGESPMAEKTEPEWLDKIMHARVTVQGQVLMLSDCPPGRYEKPAGFGISINVTEPEEAERIFKSLSENGEVEMPIQETFWAKRFAMICDQFGIPWMINCEKPM